MQWNHLTTEQLGPSELLLFSRNIFRESHLQSVQQGFVTIRDNSMCELILQEEENKPHIITHLEPDLKEMV